MIQGKHFLLLASLLYFFNLPVNATCHIALTNAPYLNTPQETSDAAPATLGGYTSKTGVTNTVAAGNGGLTYRVTYTAPNGATNYYSGSCSAPYTLSCVSPDSWDATYSICSPAPTCTPPETYDTVSSSCRLKECLSYEVLNGTSGQCQTPPTCGVTEKYNNATNTCFTSTLQCPEHKHASSSNDQCLPDSPLSCPVGQHDDGTYTCIANDATRCSTNQYDGEINGQAQCINKPNLDTAQQAAKDNAAATQAAEDAALQKRLDYYDARDAYLTAQKASDDDPADAQKAAAAAAAFNNLGIKQNELATSEATAQTAQKTQAKSEQSYQTEISRSTERSSSSVANNTSQMAAKQDATNEKLASIDATLKETGSLGTGDKSTDINTLGTTATNALDNSTAVTQNGSWFDSVPSIPEPGACITIPMNYKALQYTLNPCDKLAAFREMFAYFLYIATTIFIIKIAVRSS